MKLFSRYSLKIELLAELIFRLSAFTINYLFINYLSIYIYGISSGKWAESGRKVGGNSKKYFFPWYLTYKIILLHFPPFTSKMVVFPPCFRHTKTIIMLIFNLLQQKKWWRKGGIRKHTLMI